MRKESQDSLRSCERNANAFLDEAKYAISSLQAVGARYGITVLLHQGLRDSSGILSSFRSWLRSRNVTALDVPGKADDSHMYYFMKSYLWDMNQFSKVAFFDTDFVFLRNPDPVFEACKADFCAARSVWNTPEAIVAHAAAGDGFLSSLSTKYSAQLNRRGRNAWNAGFFVVSPDKARGAEVLDRWKQCNGTENFCLARVVPDVQFVSPVYNLQHSSFEGRDVNVGLLPTVAVHGKVGHMKCHVIEQAFGKTTCGTRVEVDGVLEAVPGQTTP